MHIYYTYASMYRTHDNPWYQIKAWADFKASGGVEKQAVASWRLPKHRGGKIAELQESTFPLIPRITLSDLSNGKWVVFRTSYRKKTQRIPRRGQNVLPYLHGPSKHQLLEVPPASWALFFRSADLEVSCLSAMIVGANWWWLKRMSFFLKFRKAVFVSVLCVDESYMTWKGIITMDHENDPVNHPVWILKDSFTWCNCIHR